MPALSTTCLANAAANPAALILPPNGDEFVNRLFQSATIAMAVVRGREHRFIKVNLAFEALVCDGRPAANRSAAEIFGAAAPRLTKLFDDVLRENRSGSLREQVIVTG